MKKWLAKVYSRLAGWKFHGQIPEPHRFVILAAPHTSNWDLPAMLCLAWTLGLRVRWMGKHTLFRWPFGGLMRWMGGVPIDRRAAHGTVAQAAKAFADHDEFILLIPPEGTRSRAEYWKSGFYHIAVAAEVPLLLGFLDWSTHRGGVSEPLWPSGDIRSDMDRIREFYRPFRAKHPECFGPIRLREEEAATQPETGSSPPS